MYTDTHKLTRAGAEQVIRGGGSVLIKGRNGQTQSITRLEDLPDETFFTAQQRVTREDAEAALKANGSFTFNGQTYDTAADLPSAKEFDEQHAKAMAASRKSIEARRDALNAQLKASEPPATANADGLDDLKKDELLDRAEADGVEVTSGATKQEIIDAIRAKSAQK